MSKPLICVTGGSGYIALHVCRILVESDKYTVRCTVRSKSPEKTDYLESIGVEIFDNCDLLVDGSFDKAFDGCKYVVHCASPFFFKAPGGDGNNFVKPALEGTKNVCNSIDKAGTVERLVLTSSCAAVAWQDSSKHPDAANGPVWSEDDWQMDSTLEKGAYRLSKRLAELAAWEYVNGNDKITMAVINPSFVLGPTLTPRFIGASIGFQKSLIDGSTTKLTPSGFGCVDVRDVANAHVNALTVDLEQEGLKNKRGEARFILSSEVGVSRTEIAKILKASGKFDQYPIPLEVDGDDVPLAKYSHARAEKYLNIKFTPVEQTIIDGAQSIADMLK